MMSNENKLNKFINENNFYDNLRIIYIEETKKLHIALLDTRGANFNSDNQSATLNEKFFNNIQKTYKEDSKNIKSKPIPRAIPNTQVSSLAILFDLIEEILFNEKNKELQLNFKNTPGFGVTFGIKTIADQFSDQGGLENAKDINRFGRLYAFMIKWGLIFKSEVGKYKSTFGMFQSESMHALCKKHFGENYLDLINNLNFPSLVKNISSIKNSPQQDFLYEIEFNRLTEKFQSFLQNNQSIKKSANGMKMLDSKLFMQNFFPDFIKENLICEKITDQLTIIDITDNGNPAITSHQENVSNNNNNQSIASDENDEELFEDAVDSFDGQNVETPTTLSNVISMDVDENRQTTSQTQDTNNNDQIPVIHIVPEVLIDSKRVTQNDLNDQTNKNKSNLKQTQDINNNKSSSNSNLKQDQKKQSSLFPLIKKLCECLKHILKKSEFKTSLSEMKTITKQLTQIEKRINSLDKNSEQYKKYANKYNQLLGTYNEDFAKAKNFIDKSKNKKQRCSRTLKLEKVTSVKFSPIEISAGA